MGKIESWVDKKKLQILEKALHKGESISEKHSWTIYVLVDLKVVYILTYAYITIVNLISSTANSEASSDTDSMMLFNVTLSPELRGVEVDSISDAILWNCRRQSMTNYYYRFLYWILIIAMSSALVGYFVVKLVALITVSCFCKNCSCPCVLNECGLIKLWQIAVLKELKVIAEDLWSQRQQQQLPTTGNETASAQAAGTNEQPQSDSDPQSNGDPQSNTQVVVADVENNTDAGNVSGRNNSSDVSQAHQSSLQAEDNAHDEIQASHDSMQISPAEVDSVKIETDKSTQSSKFELKDYKSLLSEEVTSDIFKDLKHHRSKCTIANYCRQILPGSLLFLSVITLGLSYLSYDLHPLTCIVQPAEEFISYNATSNRVEIDFSNHLRDFQRSTGAIVIVLSLAFLFLAWCFYYLSNKVIEYIKDEAKNHIDKITKQLGSKRPHREDTITGHHLPTPDN